MLRNLLQKVIFHKEALFFVSLLPIISLLVGSYARLVTFKDLDESVKFDSPVSSYLSRLPKAKVGSSSAEARSPETETQSTLSAVTKTTGDKSSSPTPATAITKKEETPKAVTVTSVTNRINFPNNKFGVHIFSNDADIDLAAQLVNSNGGDWGWVTITMDIHERNADKWNALFAHLLDKHLNPIIQLSNNGQIPSEDDVEGLSAFLAGLGWPTRIRPITVFSEVNASEYWGGKIDPEGYARILNKVVESFKAKSSEFFIMNGAFNASARTGSSEVGCIKTDLGVDTCYLSEIEFLKRVEAAVPGLLKKLDGWATHTYPHPAYKGRPSDTRVGAESSFEAGRNTIRSYQFEVRLLATFGISLPIFITETGWPHKEGKTAHPEWYDQGTVAEYYRQAFQDIFLPDGRVVAVTPFILKFDSYDNFAFVNENGEKFPQWSTITNFTKVAGAPPANR